MENRKSFLRLKKDTDPVWIFRIFSLPENRKTQTRSVCLNKKGFASVEATVLLVLFSVMLYYAFGFFGVVHTGLVHNIHSRTYTFETFRHRANLMYFRSNRQPLFHYYNMMTRLHGVNTDTKKNASNQVATERSISMGLVLTEEGRDASVHSRDVFGISDSTRNRSVGVNPVWITTMYGICLNSQCEK